MNRYSSSFLLAFLLLFSSNVHADWGKTGHRATGEIASKYLTKKAKKKIAELLQGESLAKVSIYADEIRSDRAYDQYGPWHYVNFPIGKKYGDELPAENGDIVQGIKTCIAKLKDAQTTAKDKAFYLKMLVHFYGDLHQPLHVGVKENKGGNDIQVQWFGRGSNLHRVWDSDLIDYYKMSYSELADNIEGITTKSDIKELQAADLMTCVNESRQLAIEVYNASPTGEKLGYEYAYIFMPKVLEQLQKSGIRLAAVLNEIFK